MMSFGGSEPQTKILVLLYRFYRLRLDYLISVYGSVAFKLLPDVFWLWVFSRYVKGSGEQTAVQGSSFLSSEKLMRVENV